VAGYDDRFRGHIDLALSKSDLVEIKSTNWTKFRDIVHRQAADPRHLAQVQMYLRHGGWQRAFIVYIARDVPHAEFTGYPLYVLEVVPDPGLADALDTKAQAILAAIDAGSPPACDCGWCRV
jgi:hypothetical protein